MKEKKKSTWGGERKGAGRPRMGEGIKVSVSIALDPSVARFAKEHFKWGEFGKWVEHYLRLEMRREARRRADNGTL